MYIVKSTFKGYLDIGIGTLGPGQEAPLDQLNETILAYQSAGRVTVTFKEGGVFTAPVAREVPAPAGEPASPPVPPSLSSNPVIPPAPEGAGEGLDGLKTEGMFGDDESEEKSDEDEAKDDEPSSAGKEHAQASQGGKHKGKHRR